MIDQVGEGNRLTIGEGVETTLAALQLGLSYNRDQPELRSRILPADLVQRRSILRCPEPRRRPEFSLLHGQQHTCNQTADYRVSRKAQTSAMVAGRQHMPPRRRLPANAQIAARFLRKVQHYV